MATIHNVSADAPSRHLTIYKISYTHDMKMGAHYYERPDVPPSESSGRTTSCIRHMKIDALHYEFVDASSLHSDSWNVSYTSHMGMDAPDYEWVDASSRLSAI